MLSSPVILPVASAYWCTENVHRQAAASHECSCTCRLQHRELAGSLTVVWRSFDVTFYVGIGWTSLIASRSDCVSTSFCAWHCLLDMAPSHLSELCRLVSEFEGRRHLRSSGQQSTVVIKVVMQSSVDVRLAMQDQSVERTTWDAVILVSKHSDDSERHFCLHTPQNLSVKNFWKSVNIWCGYGQKFAAYCFGPRGILLNLWLILSYS